MHHVLRRSSPLLAAIARSERVSREIRDIHASALCEKYGNNIAEAKQNSPLHMKYAGSPAPCSHRLPLLLIHLAAPFAASGARPRFARAFTPFLFLKHLICRDLESAPPIRPTSPTEYKCGFRERERRNAILGELATKNRRAREARRPPLPPPLPSPLEKRDLRMISKISRAPPVLD